jgi:hypothetical protein
MRILKNANFMKSKMGAKPFFYLNQGKLAADRGLAGNFCSLDGQKPLTIALFNDIIKLSICHYSLQINSQGV